MDTLNLKDVNKKLDELINVYHLVKDDNRRLKAESDGWGHERQRLLQQNEMARNKIAEMISRLRDMEQQPHD
jgi:cell division protein ZapB